MIVSTQGIVLNTVKYGDTGVIAKIYTRESGTRSFLIKGVRGKSAVVRPSHLMPLNLLELVMQDRQSSGLQMLKELKCDPVLSTLHYDMEKCSVVMFMKEMLNIVIREEEKNEGLFDFLWSSIQILDIQQEKVTLFPLFFLVQLTRFLGFFPDGNYSGEDNCFNMPEGRFCPESELSPYLLGQEESRVISTLRDLSYEKLPRCQVSPLLRQKTLNNLLDYYRLHLHHFKELQSPLILREVLAAGSA
jgi:DNA repair protein RecO (recombination protein O)